MEWILNVNDMLKDDITKITNALIPPGFEGDVRSIRRMQDSLSRVINNLGELSAAEQGLSKVITTADKLRTADNHVIYLVKDATGRNNTGELVGMLKVGRKHLFLFDEKQVVREVEPLCVLDFFVLREYQRHGYGKQLFDYMLKDMNTTADRLAVDGPSEKIEAFLAKNYGITRLIRQNNNFAISSHFFDMLECEINHSAASTPSMGAAVGRYTAHKPQSSIGNVIHGGGGSSTRGNFSDGEGQSECATPAASPVPAPAPAPAPVAAPLEAVLATAAAEAGRSPSRPRTLPVSAALEPASIPVPAPPSAEVTPAGALSRRDSQLTDKGFFDVKFYHKKLW